MNSKLLKEIIKAKDRSQSVLADAMGISLSRLNAKINETKAEFTQSEIAFIRDRYNLTYEEIGTIFFG